MTHRQTRAPRVGLVVLPSLKARTGYSAAAVGCMRHNDGTSQ